MKESRLPGLIPKVVAGETSFAELGATNFKWTILEFKAFLDLGQTIKSPSFRVEVSELSKVVSFHLEMEIPDQTPPTRCPVFLIQETDGRFATKIVLQSFSPEATLRLDDFRMSSDVVAVQTSLNVRKRIMTATLSPYRADIPIKVTLDLRIAICRPTEKTALY